MASRLRFRPSRFTALLAVLVIVLGAISLYALSQGARFGPNQPTASERALTQLRDQLGPTAELRYVEPGSGRALCGYGGLHGDPRAVAFVSRPNRILLSDDPLGAEFRELRDRFCAGFNRAPPATEAL